MSLTGRTKSQSKPQPAPKIRLSDLADQLDHEWTTLKQDSVEMHGEHAGLLAYYHCCVRPALHWIDGDPYRVIFPEPYQQERLAGLCRWLTEQQAKPAEAAKLAREQMLAGLLASWPAYRDLAYPDMPQEWPGSLAEWEVPPFTWEAIEELWQGENWTGEGDKARALFLPAFRYRASADFHLAALAVLFTNRQCRYYLSDIKPHRTGDGRERP